MEYIEGQIGWKEFQRNRKNILDEYEKIKDQTSNRPIKVAHGVGVEAYLRKWLSEFLPKKFGVTSGYIIPNLYKDSSKLYHFDIIIYDKLESPVLWTEGNEDQSEQGKYRAIPADHVLCIYEVKSKMNTESIKNVKNKLLQIDNFKNQLSESFSCGCIFIELEEKNKDNQNILKKLIEYSNIYRFSSGIVLRYNGDHSITGDFNIQTGKNSLEEKQNTRPIVKPLESLNIYRTEKSPFVLDEPGAGCGMVVIRQNTIAFYKSYTSIYELVDSSIHLTWSRNNFSQFCIQLISNLQGFSINDKKRPSFGRVFDPVKLKVAPSQANKQVSGQPFMKINIYDDIENTFKIKEVSIDGEVEFHFGLKFENWSNEGIVFSDDLFKTETYLDQKSFVVRKVRLFKKMILNNKNLSIADGIEIPYRIVYHTADKPTELIGLDKTFIYKNKDIVVN